MSSQRGQLFRAPAGTWAIRFYDARGQRHQRNGFRTRGGGARGARGGAAPRAPRPAVPSARDGARAGRRVPGAVRGRAVQLCVASVQPRHGLQAARGASGSASSRRSRSGRGECRCPRSDATRAHRALRQALEAALRWKWIEENPAALVKNPAPKLGEIDPFESWAEIDAIIPEFNLVGGVLVEFLVGTGRATGGGVRRRVARRAARATAWSPSSARSPRAG